MDEFFTLPVDINDVKTFAEITNNVLVNLMASRDQLDMDVYVRDTKGNLVAADQKQYNIISEKIAIMSTAKAGLDQLSKRTIGLVPADLATAICNDISYGRGGSAEQQCLDKVQRFYDELRDASWGLTVAEMREYVAAAKAAARQQLVDKHRQLALKRSLELLELQKMNEHLKRLNSYQVPERLPPTQSAVLPSGMPIVTPAPATGADSSNPGSGDHTAPAPAPAPAPTGGTVTAYPIDTYYDKATGITWYWDPETQEWGVARPSTRR